MARALAADPPARIARFAGDRAAAISYTFDDALRDQYTLGVPMLNEAGFKGTFFIIPGRVVETPEEAEKIKNEKRAWGSICWPELKEMAAQGHEIGNHAWSHPGLTKLTPQGVDEEFSKASEAIKTRIGQAPLTLAFPFNQSTPEIQAAALKSHVAYRAYQLGISGKTTVESFNDWADKQVRDGKWGVAMFHAVGSGYAALTDPEIFRAHLRYVKGREKDIWVDTFANVARCEKERDDAKLSVTGSPGRVTCALTGTLDPVVYNVPLTIVVEAPGAKSASAKRGGQDLPVRVASGSIQVDAVPAAEPITKLAPAREENCKQGQMCERRDCQ